MRSRWIWTWIALLLLKGFVYITFCYALKNLGNKCSSKYWYLISHSVPSSGHIYYIYLLLARNWNKKTTRIYWTGTWRNNLSIIDNVLNFFFQRSIAGVSGFGWSFYKAPTTRKCCLWMRIPCGTGGCFQQIVSGDLDHLQQSQVSMEMQ